MGRVSGSLQSLRIFLLLEKILSAEHHPAQLTEPLRMFDPLKNIQYLADRDFLQAACSLISGARYSIKISNYIFSDSVLSGTNAAQALAGALLLAPTKIKQCRMLLASGAQSMGHSDPSLVSHGILSNAGWSIRRSAPSKKAHAKIIIVDAEHVIIGSHNYNLGGLLHNHEASALISSSHFAFCAENHFDAAYATAGANHS